MGTTIGVFILRHFIFAKSCRMPCSKIFADPTFHGLHHMQKYIDKSSLEAWSGCADRGVL